MTANPKKPAPKTKQAAPRAPAAFRLETTKKKTADQITFDEVPETGPETATGNSRVEDSSALIYAPGMAKPAKSRRWPWGKLFFSAALGLISFTFGLWAYDSVVALFSRNDWLGWGAIALAGLAGVAFLGFCFSEISGLMRLKHLSHLREQSAHAGQSATAANRFETQLVGLYAKRADLAHARAEIARHKSEIIDPADRVALAERIMLAPLDAQAKRLVADTARRVSVVTAVSPAALVDLGFVAFSHMRLIRSLAELYGSRPGYLALMRLSRQVITHLAVTGGMAVGEGLIQQVLGHGLAARLSARLGEGVLNGLLATRVGLSAIDMCRPMPFTALPRPTVTELATSLSLTTSQTKGKDPTEG